MVYNGGRVLSDPCWQCDEWQKAVGEKCVHIGVGMIMFFVL